MRKIITSLWLLAVIFYFGSTGRIYGVHGDLASAPPVPEGILNIIVPGGPDNIPWPIPAERSVGTEQTSKVNLVTKNLEARTDLPFSKQRALDKAIENSRTVADLKAALAGRIQVR